MLTQVNVVKLSPASVAGMEMCLNEKMQGIQSHGGRILQVLCTFVPGDGDLDSLVYTIVWESP